MEYQIYYLLSDLRVYGAKLLLHLLRIGHIDNIVEDVIADAFFNDASCSPHCHSVLFDLLLSFPESYWVLPRAYFDEVSYVFFYEHGFCKV